MTRTYLGEFEHLVLLAILRFGDAAYAPAILDELEQRTGRVPSPGSMYVTLDRLEEKGFLRSRLGRCRRRSAAVGHAATLASRRTAFASCARRAPRS